MSYVTASSAGVTVSVGQVTSNVDFVLLQGGQLSGFLTRDGINPLPGIGVVAFDSASIPMAQETSGSDGRFRMVNLATGTYTLEPVLGSGETSSPGTRSGVVSVGVNVDVGTFTVTGAAGTIRGAVTEAGRPIATGVMLLATTSTIVGAPPPLHVGSLTGAAYYAATSYEDGSYQLEVRGSTTTTYRVYAYYPRWNNGVVTLSSATVIGVGVNPGAVAAGIDFTW
jgi:hypothetical protein